MNLYPLSDPGPHTLNFCKEDGETIGKLYLESPMRFEGDAEESARIFFEHVIKRATETN
jgi:hypothetical protein